MDASGGPRSSFIARNRRFQASERRRRYRKLVLVRPSSSQGLRYSYGSQVETIESVDVVDKHTVRFKLFRWTGPFLVYMASPGSSIVPKKLVDPVGSGPFKFASYEPRSAIKFE
jgi:peptide/nickel transport system substrate-binding protein